MTQEIASGAAAGWDLLTLAIVKIVEGLMFCLHLVI